jgi:hypothetical protein
MMTVLIGAAVLTGCGEPRNLLAPQVATTAAQNVRLASVQPQQLMVQKLPETGTNLIGAFNLMNGSRSSEALRFYGTRQALTKVTVQNGPTAAPRPITPAEASRYGQLLAQARTDQTTSELKNLLGAWASKKSAAPVSQQRY